ncbi:MAG: nitrogen fixation protein NifU [Spirochaetes bacterium DG_61]|jgi:NifU-like protein|nr:MAG: nitrogen fixation protein NifU [Spirochaetes bacterium DG_61]
MAKSDLIGGALWEQYSSKVNERMSNPSYMGDITEEEAKKLGGKLIVADYGAEVCGDAIRLYWIVDPKTDKILASRYKTFGCGTAIASSDVMAEMCVGRTVDEALRITNLDVERALRDDENKSAIPPQKMHCSVMAYDVIKKAASLYKGVDVTSLEEEDIVCECARVPLRTIKEVIRLNDLKTVEEITNFTKAGAFCKSCVQPGGHEKRRYYLVDILNEVRQEMENEKVAKGLEIKDFSLMNLIQKHKSVEQVLNEKVRPSLLKEGGNLEVVDMKEQDGITQIYIHYLGACAGCPSSKTGTLTFIEGFLKNELSDSIEVIIV